MKRHQESVYSEVGASKIRELKARELFNDKIYAVKWNKWWTIILILSFDWKVLTFFTWVNRTGAPYTMPDGKVVAAGESIKVEGSETINR